MKVTLTLALALVALLAPAAGAADRQARIYGGSPVADIADAPFQAALVHNPHPANLGQFCAGSIRDALHVITAAHCVFGAGQATAPAATDVLVGTADLAEEEAPAKRVGVSAISFDPRYDPRTFAYDAAVLTLAAPLDLSAGQPARAATTVEPTAWTTTPPGTMLRVSGWGRIDSGQYPDDLREAEVPLRDDQSCDAAYRGAIDHSIMVCAGDPMRDSCSGDSGGPLSLDTDAGPGRDLRLAGIVSFGPASGCADDLLPGVYTEINGPVRSFVEASAPTPAPRSTSPAGIAGTARVGDVLTCSPGAWSESPAYGYRFLRGSTLVRGPSPDPAYAVQQGDLGAQLTCEATATNAGGYGIAASGFSAPVEPALAQAQPPSATPLPVAPRPALRPVPPIDRVAPVARIAKLSCSRTRCTLDVRVRDAGFSSGVRRLEAKLVSTYRTRCRRGGRRVPCTRIRARSVRAATLAMGGFRVRVTGLPRGRHSFTVRAVDRAGNRQAIVARRTGRTSGPR